MCDVLRKFLNITCVFFAVNSEAKSSSEGRNMRTSTVSTTDPSGLDSSVTTQSDTFTRYAHRTVETLLYLLRHCQIV